MKRQLLVFKGTDIPILNGMDSFIMQEEGCPNPPCISRSEPLAAKEYDDTELGLLALKYGAKKITTYRANVKKPLKESVPPVETSKYYNGELNRLIIQYKMLKSSELIRKIGEQKFLIPIKTFNGDKKRYPTIRYAHATLKENKMKCHVVFSDYDEYELWKKYAQTSWGLIIVGKYELRHINRKYNLLINPCGNRLYLEGDKKKEFFYQMEKR